jgi:tRNA dimethylallyltransferase
VQPLTPPNDEVILAIGLTNTLPDVATLPPLLVIAGPTATGKTGLSLRLAAALRGEGIHVEIISADSRQVYRGLEIGTAKVSSDDRARVPHHGLDLVDPDEPFSVADFVDHAQTALATIEDRGGIALLVGGTGLYLRAVARGIDTANLPHDPEVRSRIEEELAARGIDAAAQRLRELAPSASADVDLRNPRRVARALEIAEIVGDRPRPTPVGYPSPVAWLGLTLDRAVHHQWIATRARQQFESGLIDEARLLRERFDVSLPAFSAIGYREAWAVLDGGLTEHEAVAEDVRRNVAFAKRQRSWFRSEPEIVWHDAAADPLPNALKIARRLAEAGG